MGVNPLTWLTDYLPSAVSAGIAGAVIATLSTWMGYRQGHRHGESIGKIRLFVRVLHIVREHPRDATALLISLAQEVQKESHDA